MYAQVTGLCGLRHSTSRLAVFCGVSGIAGLAARSSAHSFALSHRRPTEHDTSRLDYVNRSGTLLGILRLESFDAGGGNDTTAVSLAGFA